MQILKLLKLDFLNWGFIKKKSVLTECLIFVSMLDSHLKKCKSENCMLTARPNVQWSGLLIILTLSVWWFKMFESENTFCPKHDKVKKIYFEKVNIP